MGDKTGIQWTEATWNPVVGCSVVSPGCTNCYAMKMADRLAAMAPQANGDGNPHLLHYVGTTTRDPTKRGYDWSPPVWTGKLVQAPEATLTQPLRWAKPRIIFVNSMSDMFHESVPDAWIDRVFAIMALAPKHSFQVLTKRSARMRAYMNGPETEGRVANAAFELAPVGQDIGETNLTWSPHERPTYFFDGRWPLPNVWLGVSAEDQRRADDRVPDLLATPAAVRFVSAEPLLGPVYFTKVRPDATMSYDALIGRAEHLLGMRRSGGPRLDWIIVGGESGPGARLMHPQWARDIRDQCAAAGVAYFFKQWGAWAPAPDDVDDSYEAHRARGARDYLVFPDLAAVELVGKHRAGRLLDGVEHNAMPEVRA